MDGNLVQFADGKQTVDCLVSLLGGLHVRCEQGWETFGIAARHAAFGRHAVDPNMAPGSSEASSVAGHIVAVNEAEMEDPADDD